MTYIITGVSGFIGYNLAGFLLKNSNRVIALVGPLSKLEKINTLKGIEIIHYIKDADEVISRLKDSGAHCFIHCAWSGVSGNDRNNINQFFENIPFSLMTLKIASEIKCDQWIGLGSQAEYGIVNERINETRTANPATSYAHVKNLVYQCMKEFSSFTTMKLTWVRIFSIYGPHDNSKNFIPYLIQSFKNNIEPTITSCEQDWDYLYVDDAAEAIYKLSEKKAEGVYNLGSGSTVKLRYVVEEIKKQMDINMNIVYGNKKETVSLNHLEADISKIKNKIEWTPQTSIQEGLNKTIKFYTQ